MVRKLMVVIAIVAMAGCVGRPSDPGAEGPRGVFRPATEREVSATEYRVGPPDKLAIRAPGVKELDSFVTQVRPDGRISVNLVGEVYVAGKTPEELGALLTAAAGKYYNGVAVQVEVTEYNSKFYTVFGTAVRSGGRKAYTGRVTVIGALAEAGFTDEAWPQQVHLSRPGRAGQERSTAIVDLKQIYTCGDTRQNYLLEEGDVVYVPPGPLVAFSKTMQRVLSPMTGVSGAASSVTPAPR